MRRLHLPTATGDRDLPRDMLQAYLCHTGSDEGHTQHRQEGARGTAAALEEAQGISDGTTASSDANEGSQLGPALSDPAEAAAVPERLARSTSRDELAPDASPPDGAAETTVTKSAPGFSEASTGVSAILPAAPPPTAVQWSGTPASAATSTSSRALLGGVASAALGVVSSALSVLPLPRPLARFATALGTPAVTTSDPNGPAAPSASTSVDRLTAGAHTRGHGGPCDSLTQDGIDMRPFAHITAVYAQAPLQHVVTTTHDAGSREGSFCVDLAAPVPPASPLAADRADLDAGRAFTVVASASALAPPAPSTTSSANAAAAPAAVPVPPPLQLEEAAIIAGLRSMGGWVNVDVTFHEPLMSLLLPGSRSFVNHLRIIEAKPLVTGGIGGDVTAFLAGHFFIP